MQKITLQKGEAIEIEGVYLNEVILSQLEKFQKECNESLYSFREDISDAICKLLQYSENEETEETEKEILILVRNLSYHREYLCDLRKTIA